MFRMDYFPFFNDFSIELKGMWGSTFLKKEIIKGIRSFRQKFRNSIIISDQVQNIMAIVSIGGLFMF